MKIIDASNLILGRLASKVSKLALEGEQVAVVNCEKAVISGSRMDIFQQFLKRSAMGGPFHGPFINRQSDRIVRRAIRGMLPWARSRGREAYKRVMCYLGVPIQFKDKELETIESANVSKLSMGKFVKLSVIANRLGGK